MTIDQHIATRERGKKMGDGGRPCAQFSKTVGALLVNQRDGVITVAKPVKQRSDLR
ncbi:hypothetical protein SRABI106_04324 [Rahnella aquatilis]|nr:hypothetical protein SRABI106_04324 [Rahnella aquatilis]